MNSKPIARIIAIAATLAAAALAPYQCPQKTAVAPVEVVDEVVATQHFLDERFSSPRYFGLPAGHSHEAGGPWVEVADALAQVDRIVAARMLGPEAAAKVRLLVEELAEPNPSRSVGGWRVSLMRLNLLLDAIK